MEKRIKAFPEKSSLLALLMKVLKVSYWILPFRILKKFRKKAIPPLDKQKKRCYTKFTNYLCIYYVLKNTKTGKGGA
jgi:hypothetical protein